MTATPASPGPVAGRAPDRGVSRLVRVSLPGPAGKLEGLLQEREAAGHPVAAVLCHPHPLHGGTLHNKVVHRMAGVLHRLGAAVLRFNFRGAGRSEGRFDGGEGELADARVALAFLAGRHPAAAVWVGGFSFGAWVAARLAVSAPGIEQLVLVAPPVGRSSFDGLRSSPVPKLVVQGTDDAVCPLASLKAAFAAWAEPRRLVVVDGANHFFDRQLGALAKALSEALPQPRRKEPR